LSALATSPDRRAFIGGSDIAAILGIHPWKNAVDLYLDKTSPPVDDEENARAKLRGKRLEPYMLDMVRAEYGVEIIANNMRHIDACVPYFAAEIDAEIYNLDALEGVTGFENVELKTVHPFKSREWGVVDTDELPLHYLAQCQWGLSITQRQVCHVFALIGDDLRRYVVVRDEATIEAMRRRAEHFWNEYVARLVCPPLDYSDEKTLDTLKRLYPGTDGSTIEASAAHEHWRAVLGAAQDMAAKYEAVIDGAKAHLLAEMGNAALLRFADGKAFRRRLIERKECVIAASKFMDFRLVNTKEKA